MIRSPRFVKAAIVLMLFLVLQLELFSELRIFGVMPEVLLGLAVAGGWQGGATRGAMFGFAIGLMYDVFLPTPLALNAATYAIVAYAIGVVSETLADGAERLVRRLFSIAAVATGLALFVTLGELLAQPNLYNGHLPKVLIIATLYTALLMPILHVVGNWVMRVDDPMYAPSSSLIK